MTDLRNKMSELEADISGISKFAKDKRKRISNSNDSNLQNLLS